MLDCSSAYKMRLVGSFLLCKNGRKAIARFDMLVKLMDTSELNFLISNASGLLNSYRPWTPALRKIQSISGDLCITLEGNLVLSDQ